MDTEPVTVTTLVLVLVKLTVRPPGGAGVDRLMGRLRAWPGPSVWSVPRLITLVVTVMPRVPFSNLVPSPDPVAAPVMVVGPAATPVMVKCAEVWPGLIVTVLGVMVTRFTGLLVSVTVTPPAPAGAGIVAAPLIVRPTPTSAPSAVSAIPEIGVTVTVALSLAGLPSVGAEAVRVAMLA